MPNDISEKLNSQISAVKIQGQNIQADKNGETDEINYPYVIFQLYENRFAVNCKYVVSIEPVTKTTEIVNASKEVRKISYYKNEPVSIYDLRRLFGLISNEEYLQKVVDLPQRIKDHEKYAQTLENCINTKTPFELNVDPHKCAFGKWYESYKTEKISNRVILTELKKLEFYHDQFHKTAETVRDYISEGKIDEAAKYSSEIVRQKDYIVKALSDINDIMAKNISELTIILQLKDRKIGIIVDTAESVENIDEIQELPPSVATTNYIKRLGLSQKERQITFILEASAFNGN